MKTERLAEKKHQEQFLLSAVRRLRLQHRDGKQTFHLDACQIPRLAFPVRSIRCACCSARLASVTVWLVRRQWKSVTPLDAWGGALAWKQSLSSFFPLFSFAFVCFPFSRRNSVKLQSPKLPGEVLDQQQQQKHGRRESAKSRNHGNPQLGTKQTLLQHTHAHTTHKCAAAGKCRLLPLLLLHKRKETQSTKCPRRRAGWSSAGSRLKKLPPNSSTNYILL